MFIIHDHVRSTTPRWGNTTNACGRMRLTTSASTPRERQWRTNEVLNPLLHHSFATPVGLGSCRVEHRDHRDQQTERVDHPERLAARGPLTGVMARVDPSNRSQTIRDPFPGAAARPTPQPAKTSHNQHNCPRQPLILNPPRGRLICSRLGDGLGSDPTCRPIGSK